MSDDQVDVTAMDVLAWVGPDEFDGSLGIKSAMTPVGWIPLAFKAEHEDRARNAELRAQLQTIASTYGTQMRLVRFRYAEVLDSIDPI